MAQSGDRLLFGVSRSRLEKRPTTVTSIYQLNLNTMAVDTLVNGDGFVSGAKYSLMRPGYSYQEVRNRLEA